MGFCIKYPAIILSCLTVAFVSPTVANQQRTANPGVVHV
jgi:hypothetical protein